MDDLELLKKDWNRNSDEFKTYGQKDLFKMIKKNSVSVSKTLLIIGLVEVVLWFTMLYLDQRENESFFNIKTMIRSILFVGFISALIFFYSRIHSESDSKKLMKSILGLRKVILWYVALIFVTILVFTFIEAKEDANDMIRGFIQGQSETPLSREEAQLKVSDFEPGVMYFFYGISMVVFLILLYFVYHRVYGRLLDKLKANYHELTKLEDGNS